MQQKLPIIFLLLISLSQFSFAQLETYTIKKAPFSSDIYDEFSPVYYKKGIVFCTNRNKNGFLNYSSSQNKWPVKINFVDTTGKVSWKDPVLFSKGLKTKLNDGPVTFNRLGDTIYFSRNIMAEGKIKELSTNRNKLGIFYSVFSGNKWTEPRDLRINNEWYNVTTPWLSPDGKRLYFASDKPGGYGGSDLYFSHWKDGYWDNPVNLGPEINTKGNEAYPFINSAGELFFSSDGHPGLGGKDIFFSRNADTTWLKPVALDSPVNSENDDFGFVCDSTMDSGYFSTNRNKSIDIYQFKAIFPQIFYSNIQRENQYCFRFTDYDAIEVDTINLKYVWDFGDGLKKYGAEVNHCFSGPGRFSVKLDIVDRNTGKLYFSKLAYILELVNFEQPYISCPDVVTKGNLFNLDALNSYLPGYKVLSYSWDFGDSSRIQGASVNHVFKTKGEYSINLGLTLKSDSTGIIHKTGVSKKISVFNDSEEMLAFLSGKSSDTKELLNIKEYDNAMIQPLYSAEEEILKDAVFQVELLSSKTKIDFNNEIFRLIPKKYNIQELYDTTNRSYRYLISDQQSSLMATYPAFFEMNKLGFKDTHARIVFLNNPAEKELHNLIKIYGVSSDSYFDNYNRLATNAYIMLDQIVKLMDKYPRMRLEISVHTDNNGLPEANLALTQKRAQLLVSYLISRGINSKRLVSRGYGALKPIDLNSSEKLKRLNRRIGFTIID